GNLLERGPRRPLSVGACLRFSRSPVWRHELDNVRVAIEYEEQLEATARADCHWNRVSPETVREDIVGDTLVEPEAARWSTTTSSFMAPRRRWSSARFSSLARTRQQAPSLPWQRSVSAMSRAR